MNNQKVASTVAGVVVGAAGIIAVGFLLRKFIGNKQVEAFEEKLVEKIVESSPFKSQRKRTVKKKSKLVVAKLGNAKKLLSVMKKGKEYTQVMLVSVSKISYRSVRRYIETLVQQGKIVTRGYGKGKKFVKR
ncbi:hypothetical protein IT418_00970 [bacterium]|nr:hypothetical protein [bacterium]